jgi:hypothetical protein
MPVIQAAKTMPALPGFANITITQNSTVGLSVSPFTGQQQTQEWSGQWWYAQVTMPLMTRAQAANWVAFLVSLRGIVGTFMLRDPACKTPRGAALTTGATPLIAGNVNGGASISTKGWTPNTQNILLRSDYMQIENHLYMVLSDENSDAAGNASFDIWPDLRTQPQDGTPIIVQNAQGIFRLAENKQSWDINNALNYGIQFNCMEAI